jgi:hypothetical protein
MCADACCSAVLAGRAAHGSAAIARTIATRRACGGRTSTIYALLWSEGSHRTCESGLLGALHIAFVFEHLFYSMCGRKARRPEESATVNHQSGDALATSDLTVAAVKYGFRGTRMSASVRLYSHGYYAAVHSYMTGDRRSAPFTFTAKNGPWSPLGSSRLEPCAMWTAEIRDCAGTWTAIEPHPDRVAALVGVGNVPTD